MKFWLRTFGDLRLLDEQGHATAFPEKGLVIIACLIAADRASVPRVTVAEFLWGKSTPSTSFTNLRSLISRIKNRQLELDRHFLSFSESRIELNPSLLSCDVSAFGVAGPEEPFEKLALLVERFHEGLFLEGISLRSIVFSDWLAQQRERQTIALERAVDIARPLAAKPGEIALVKEAALLVSLAHPQDEVARRVLIEAHDAQSEVNHFRSVFERRSRLLSSWAAAAKRSVKGAVVSTRADSPTLEVPATEAAVHPMARVPRLSLLPPSNHGSDPAAAGIVTALLEDITIGFCVLNSIQVMAPYSAVQISRQTADKVAAFEHHDVSYVLDTRLSGVDSDLSLFCQLIYMASDEIVWAERFSIDGRDLARNNRDISRRLALSVASEIERHRITRAHFEQNPAAYHRYLIGRQYFSRLTLPSLRRARTLASNFPDSNALLVPPSI